MLDRTYFIGELYLPSLEKSKAVGHSSNSLQTVGEYSLDWFIEKYESEYLDTLLGEKLKNNFIYGINEDTPLKIWIDLKGKIYYKQGDIPFSPAANYVWYWVRRCARTQTTVQGEKVGDMSYASTAEDSDKLCRVWNEMCDKSEVIICYLRDNWDKYKEYSIDKLCCCAFHKINRFNI